ncbi:ARL14 effector protein-like [Cloeon dipterum]|uniref:ARL14 effector protein-like n=1 Tax=Cloeon dipterum TaxID=197152 RepID=UPI0032202476
MSKLINAPLNEKELTNRERRKLTRKVYTESKYVALYTEEGVFIATGTDLCDCGTQECPGCHFPCVKCRSLKCGHECRRNRKWKYETVKCDTVPR